VLTLGRSTPALARRRSWTRGKAGQPGASKPGFPRFSAVPAGAAARRSKPGSA